MKKFIFEFWVEPVRGQTKFLVLKITPSTWKDEGSPNGYFYWRKNVFNIFIDKYEVDERSSPDWKDYIETSVAGALRLQVYSDKYLINLNIPELVQE